MILFKLIRYNFFFLWTYRSLIHESYRVINYILILVENKSLNY